MGVKALKFELLYRIGMENDNGVTTNTKIAIKSGDSNIITITVVGDYLNRSSDELVAIALEEFYQQVYTARAEREGIEESKRLAKQAKELAEKATQILINGNTAQTFMFAEYIANERNLFEDQYKGLIMYIPEIKIGESYMHGQYVKIKDTSIPENAPTGQYVCVRLNKGDNWVYNGEDILHIEKPFVNGYDIRRYDSYPRVRLGTAVDTKKTNN